MTDYTTAGRGLKTMFIGEIVCLFSFIPFVGLIGLIVTLVGLNTASKAHPGYKTAFTIAIVNIVVSLLCVFLGPLSILVSILSVVMVYMICTTSAELLCEKGADGLEDLHRMSGRQHRVHHPGADPLHQCPGCGGERRHRYRTAGGRDPLSGLSV